MQEALNAFFPDDDGPLEPIGAAVDERIDLVPLDRDHPGFRDPIYRERRNVIARVALSYDDGDELPRVEYTAEEDSVWRSVCARLMPLHEERVVRELVLMHRVMPLRQDAIPQLADVSADLQSITGYTLRPVAGLVSLRNFLTRLGRRCFLSTQYVRHADRPLYTPEPDVIHELIGHAVSLSHPGLALVNEMMGWAAVGASDSEILRLGQLYWYTMEFGACYEDGVVKAVGAGLLSSCGELADFDQRGELLPWDLDRIAETPFDPTEKQPGYFVAPSFEGMLADLAEWVMQGCWRDGFVRGEAGDGDGEAGDDGDAFGAIDASLLRSVGARLFSSLDEGPSATEPEAD